MNGIVYTIAGQQDLPKLKLSIKTLRKVSLLPICIYCHDVEIPDLDCTIIRYTGKYTGNVVVSRILKTSIDKITPFKQTLYLDNDIIVLDDPAWIFEKIPSSGIIFASDSKTIEEYSRYVTPGKSLSNEILNRFDVKVDKDWVLWNGGVFAFNEHGKNFISKWHQNQLAIYYDLQGWTKRDQGTLAVTAWQMGKQDNPILPKRANFRHGLDKGLDNKTWTIKGTGEKITNLHMCVSWGNTKSETWKRIMVMNMPYIKPVTLSLPPIRLKQEFYSPPIPIKTQPMPPMILFELLKDRIVAPFNDQHLASPLRLMLESLSECKGFKLLDDDAVGNPCQKMIEKIGGRSGFATVVEINRKFILIEYGDHANASRNTLGKITNHNLIDLVLKCQYRPNHKTYKDYPVKILPFTYVAVNFHSKDSDFLKYREMFNKHEFKYDVFGRLAKHKPRIPIVDQCQFEGADVKLIGLNHGKHQISKTDGRLAKEEYFTRLTQSRFGVDAPGNGNLTHRLIEGFGMGMPIICPVLKNSFYVDLIPDYHYIACRDDGLDIKDLVDHYKNNYSRALTIAKNGMDYFDRYCSRKGVADLFLNIVNSHLMVS